MPNKLFDSREELIKLLKTHSWGYGVGEIRFVCIFWNESIVGEFEKQASPSPNSIAVIYLRTPQQVEIFLNRNLCEMNGHVYIHNQLGSYLGF